MNLRELQSGMQHLHAKREKLDWSVLRRTWNTHLKPRARRVRFSTALMVGGAALLAYVLWAYAAMHFEQKRLEAEWEAQQQNSAATVQPVSTATMADGLTKLTIPKINLDAIVVAGTTNHDLRIGPGWMTDTAAPGDLGNAVISGHRDTFFRHIVELNKGDLVEVRRNGKTFTYEVTGKKIVSPDDVSVIQPSSDRRLTLITCYPTYYIGPAPDRLVVFTKSVDAPPQGAQPQDTQATSAAHGGAN